MSASCDRLQCEARYWNQKIRERMAIRSSVFSHHRKQPTDADVRIHREEIFQKIKVKRGDVSAQTLLDEMERQWALSSV